MNPRILVVQGEEPLEKAIAESLNQTGLGDSWLFLAPIARTVRISLEQNPEAKLLVFAGGEPDEISQIMETVRGAGFQLRIYIVSPASDIRLAALSSRREDFALYAWKQHAVAPFHRFDESFAAAVKFALAENRVAVGRQS